MVIGAVFRKVEITLNSAVSLEQMLRPLFFKFWNKTKREGKNI